MLINGYTVDKNLPAFRKAFFLPDILDHLDNQFAIWKWTGDMCNLPHLPTHAKDRLVRIKCAMWDFFEENNNDWTIEKSTCSEQNTIFRNQLLKRKQKVTDTLQARYQNICYIILELMEIAEYAATDQDMDTFEEYLQKHNYFPAVHLEIKLYEGRFPKLYYGDQLVTELPHARKYTAKELVTVAEQPSAGYLGISKDGNLVNGSAFAVPVLKKRPVKVLLNQLYYVILLEDGTLVHNLRFCSRIPTVPVRDVILDKDHIRWTQM